MKKKALSSIPYILNILFYFPEPSLDYLDHKTMGYFQLLSDSRVYRKLCYWNEIKMRNKMIANILR